MGVADDGAGGALPPGAGGEGGTRGGPVDEGVVDVVAAALGVGDVAGLDAGYQLGELFVKERGAVGGVEGPHAWGAAEEVDARQAVGEHGAGEDVFGEVVGRHPLQGGADAAAEVGAGWAEGADAGREAWAVEGEDARAGVGEAVRQEWRRVSLGALRDQTAVGGRRTGEGGADEDVLVGVEECARVGDPVGGAAAEEDVGVGVDDEWVCRGVEGEEVRVEGAAAEVLGWNAVAAEECGGDAGGGGRGVVHVHGAGVRVLGAGVSDQLLQQGATLGPGGGEAAASAAVEIDDKQDLVDLGGPLAQLVGQDVARVGVVGGREADLQGDAGHIVRYNSNCVGNGSGKQQLPGRSQLRLQPQLRLQLQRRLPWLPYC